MYRQRIGIVGAIAALSCFLGFPAQGQESVASSANAGSAVVVPYYTVRSGWETLINVTNTTANTLAVKLGFHEGRNGRDVGSAILVLAPDDVWTGWLAMGEERPLLRTTDRSCVVPLSLKTLGLPLDEDRGYSGATFSPAPGGVSRYTDHSGTNRDLARLREGYNELLVMGEAAGESAQGSVPWSAGHESGEPRDCAMVADAFAQITDSWFGGPVKGESGSGDPMARGADNFGPIMSRAPLRVNATLVNTSRGVAAGITPTYLEGWGANRNFVTAHEFPWFHEPTLASHNGFWDVSGIAEIRAALAVRSLQNEWTSNEATGAASDWVVTFPLKRFQTDEHAKDIRAGCSLWRNPQASGGAPFGDVGDEFDGWSAENFPAFKLVDDADAVNPQRLCPSLGYPEVFEQDNNGQAAVLPLRLTFKDRDAQPSRDEQLTLFSPETPVRVANVLAISESGLRASALDSATALSVRAGSGASDVRNGVLEATFSTATGETSKAVTGFVFKVRDFGDATKNFAQSASHGRSK